MVLEKDTTVDSESGDGSSDVVVDHKEFGAGLVEKKEGTAVQGGGRGCAQRLVVGWDGAKEKS